MRRALIRRFLNSELQPDQLFQRCKAFAWRGQGPQSLELYPNLRTAPVSYHLAVLNAFTSGDVCDANSAEQWLNFMSGSSSASSSSQGIGRNVGTRPTSDCFVMVAKAFAQKEQFKHANDVLDRMRREDLDLNVEQYEALIKAYSSHGRVKDVEHFCEQMQENKILPTITCYNHLIRAHANNDGDTASAIKVLDELPSRLKATVGSFNGVLQAASKKGDKKLADDCMNRMEMLRIVPDKSSFSSVITACARDSNVSAAMSYLEDMKKVKLKVDLECFTGVLTGYARQGNTKAAAELLQKMTESKIEPDRVSFNCVLDAFGKANDVQGASKVLESMRAARMTPNVISYTGVISGFCRKRDFMGALRTIKKMEDDGIQPDVVIFNMLISSYGRAGDPIQARRMFNRVLAVQNQQENDSSHRGKVVRPTVVTFNSIIDAYARVGDHVAAEEIFQIMTERSKIAPNVVTFACLANAYAQKKDLFGALQIVQRSQQARVSPDLKFLNGVIGAFPPEMAKQALGFVDTMQQKYGVMPDFLSYVQVVNLFVKLNDSGKVHQLLSRMEDLGLAKDDGWRATVLRAMNLPPTMSFAPPRANTQQRNDTIFNSTSGSSFSPTNSAPTATSTDASSSHHNSRRADAPNSLDQSNVAASNSGSTSAGSVHVSPSSGIHVSSGQSSNVNNSSSGAPNLTMNNISINTDVPIPRTVIKRRKRHVEENTRKKDPGWGSAINANVLSNSDAAPANVNPKPTSSFSSDGGSSASKFAEDGAAFSNSHTSISNNRGESGDAFVSGNATDASTSAASTNTQNNRRPRRRNPINMLDPDVPSFDGANELDFSLDSSRTLSENR